MNMTRHLLKKGVSDLCTMRCLYMRNLYEGKDNTQLDVEISKQEAYVNKLIEEVTA
jgi:hypothetical protein